MASLKQANTLAPSNVSASGFALGDARHLGGHRVVASLTALYALFDWQLLNPEETDTALALGQEWYVKGVGKYRLTNWDKRKGASGWTKVVDPNNMDTTLFQIVTALPTSGINKNRIYMMLSEGDAEEQNVYLEFVYTGDTGAAYDASKWEKLGEYKPEVDTSLYDNVVNRVNSGEFSNVVNFDGISTVLVKPTIQTMSVTGDYKVMYLGVTKTFVAVSAGKYYSNWGGAEAFGNLTADGRTPKKDKIYISGSKAYVWDETAEELKQIAGNDIASSTADGLMSKADKIALDALNGEISIENLDLTGRISEFITGCLPTRLKVVTLNALTKKNVTVGTLDIFTDFSGHQLTEIFTSNYGNQWGQFIEDFESIAQGHKDGAVFTCHRCYNHSMPSTDSGIAKGTWSKWRGGTDDFSKGYMDAIANSVVTVGHKEGINELALQKDSNGQGYVTVKVMSSAEVDALFV